ncbi:MAG: hypothetical protein PHO37_14690 [Kiritimatiellae bacterium]|nr:hypothetical protein [Kiritimatiellia bacterium]
MFVEKMIIETDALGRLKKVPLLPPNKRLETIFLVVGDSVCNAPVKRQPASGLKGSVKIHGNILNSTPEESWNLPR